MEFLVGYACLKDIAKGVFDKYMIPFAQQLAKDGKIHLQMLMINYLAVYSCDDVNARDSCLHRCFSNVFVCLRLYADALINAHAICAVVVGVMLYRSTDHNENTA
jgi:hypothetical protein